MLFDEFHERSLDADLGLALARDAQAGLREDLQILVMSATLDGARVAKLLGGAPVIESEGRAFPVETRYLGRDARAPIERQVADAVTRALRADAGSMLVFLPGAAEIRRTETLLKERVREPAVDVVALFGALDAQEQDRAIAPPPPGRRKIVLATSIAETSLTIEGVRVVVDCGLARVPRYEPDVGVTRLETVRVSRAAADQRRGRAGRTEPGVCYRLWDEPQTASLEPYTRPEILSADLSSFALDLAQWGVADPAKLAFLDPPPAAALAEAKALLSELGALDADGRITAEGKRLRALPLPPRLARMVVDAAARGAGAQAARDRRHSHRARARRRRRRSRPSPRPVPPRPLGARRGRAADGEALGGACFATFRCKGGRAKNERRGKSFGRRHARARLSGPHRQKSRRRDRRFSARQRARRQSRSGFGAGARAVHCRRRIDRPRRAGAHRAGGDNRARRDRGAFRRRASKRARRSSSMRQAPACARAACGGSARLP